LSVFNASNNKLGGTVPASITGLAKLKTIDISYAGLTGDLPANFIYYLRPKILMMQSNQLTGSLENLLCNVPYYNVQGNQWTCPLPTCCSSQGNYLCVPCVNPNTGLFDVQ